VKRLRWIVRIVTALATVAGLAVLAAIYLFNSEPFARWVLETAASRSEGSVEIESVTGTLSSGVALGRVDVDLDFLSAQITDVEVTVDWRSIVARSVIIDSLDIGRVEARLQTSDVSSTSAAPTELAVLVLVRRLRIGEIGLVDDEQSYIVSDAALQLRVLRNRFELAMVSASWVMLRVTGDAAFTLTEDLAIDASVCIDGAFADELVRGCVAAEGQPEALQVDAQVQLPFTASAVGRVELSESGLLDLAVNWQDARLNAVPDVSSAFGTMRLSGTFDSLRVAADGAATAFGQAAQFSVDTRILGEAFEVARVRLEQDGTSAEFSGTVTRDLASLDGAL
jgi:hypothetical protein